MTRQRTEQQNSVDGFVAVECSNCCFECFLRYIFRKLGHFYCRTNALEPDFTLITGDLADGTPDRIGTFVHPITELRARYDVVISAGNHDYYSGLRPWVETWRRWGMTVLLNSHREYNVRGRNVVIAAVTDPCAVLFRSLDGEMGAPDARRALEGADEGLRILMSHRPGQAEQNAALGCHLQLSGHTHGGQFFFLFPLVSRLNGGFRSGLYRAGSMPLYVSPGTGMWGYVPMRLGVGAEITLIILRSADDADRAEKKEMC